MLMLPQKQILRLSAPCILLLVLGSDICTAGTACGGGAVDAVQVEVPEDSDGVGRRDKVDGGRYYKGNRGMVER